MFVIEFLYVHRVEEAVEIGSKMLGEILVTKQTGEKGLKCQKLMVTERKKSQKEFYICIMMERSFDVSSSFLL